MGVFNFWSYIDSKRSIDLLNQHVTSI